MSAPGRVLALDLGSKRIGVAISDDGRRVATPIGTIERTRDLVRSHREIKALVEEWDASLVVIGLPLSLDGSVGPAAASAKKEAEMLRATLAVGVETYDERLSTVTADRRLAETNLSGPARRKVIDQVAASVILQAWLDRHHD